MTNCMKSARSTAVLLGCMAIVFTWLAASCTQERQPCLTPKIASLNIRFVHFTSDTATANFNNAQDTGLPHAQFVAMTGSGLEGRQYTVPTAFFTISLSPVADSCQWMVRADTVSTRPYDTMTFYYQRQVTFLSNACGFTNFYSLDSVHTTHSSIDSVILTNRSVTNDVNTRQLKIYMHPAF